MSQDSNIAFVCDADQYAIFASTLWEVARSKGDADPVEPTMAPADAAAPPASAVTGAESDAWSEWATDPDWQVI